MDVKEVAGMRISDSSRKRILDSVQHLIPAESSLQDCHIFSDIYLVCFFGGGGGRVGRPLTLANRGHDYGTPRLNDFRH